LLFYKAPIKYVFVVLLALGVFVISGCDNQLKIFSTGEPLPREVFLEINRTDPIDGQNGIESERKIDIFFNRDLDISSLDTAKMTLHYINPELLESETGIDFEANYNADERKLILDHSDRFLEGETIELILQCNLRDTDGNSLKKYDESFLDDVCFVMNFELESQK